MDSKVPKNLKDFTNEQLLDVLIGYQKINDALANEVAKLKKQLESQKQLSLVLRQEKYDLFIKLKTLQLKVPDELQESGSADKNEAEDPILKKRLRKKFTPLFESFQEEEPEKENVPPQDYASFDLGFMNVSDCEEDKKDEFPQKSPPLEMPKPIPESVKMEDSDSPVLRKPLTQKNLNAMYFNDLPPTPQISTCPIYASPVTIPSPKGPEPVASTSSSLACLESSLQDLKPVASTSTAKTPPLAKTGGVQKTGQQKRGKRLMMEVCVKLERITNLEEFCKRNNVRLWEPRKCQLKVRARRLSSAQ